MTLAVIAVCIVAGRLLVDSNSFFEVAVAKGNVHRATPPLVWLSWVATINALVLVFNLIPAFPLDGGRIAHAAIWWRTGRSQPRDPRHRTRWGRALAGAARLPPGLWGHERGLLPSAC